MPSTIPASRILQVVLFLSLVFVPCSLDAQNAGGVQSGEPTFRVLRSVSGSKGSVQNGRFVMEDPRSTFYLPGDAKVIVYFDWEGPLGTHHFEGYWKNPEGKAVVISDFSFEAKQKKFGGYWELTLTDGTTPGMWALEAHVDGEVTGTHTFQIVAAPKPANVGGGEPQAMTAAQIYQRALASMAMIEKIGLADERLGKFSGFVLDQDLVATTFDAIDGAGTLRVSLPKGGQQQVTSLVKWNRWQNWAVLRVPTGDAPKFRRAAKAVGVGDRCYFLNASADGTRSIHDVDITGANKYPNAGERLQVSNHASIEASGSPLLNEYGDLVGIVGAGTTPGAISLFNSRYGAYGSSLRARAMLGALVLPINVVPEKIEGAETPFAELANNGQFVPPLKNTEIVGQGALTLRLDNRRDVTPMPQDEKYEFTRSDKQFTIFVMWAPKQNTKGLGNFRIYDLNNRVLLEGKPAKLNLKVNDIGYTAWQIGVETVPAGTYRMDVIVNEQPVWRTFFIVSD